MSEIEQKTPSMAEIMANFTSTSTGGEEEILRIASDYSLQISPEQIRTIMMLKMLAINYGKQNQTLAFQIETFIKEYLSIKHHHESGGFIMRVIDSLAVKRFVTPDTGKVNVMK